MTQLFHKNYLKRMGSLLPFVLIIFLASIFLFNGLRGKIIWGHDTSKISFPFTFLLDESYKKFQLRLWTPDIFFGFPIGSELGQFGVFYPLNILHAFLPLPHALAILTILHFSGAGIFTYLLLRNYKLNKIASFFGAAAFMFNGALIAHAQYPSHIYAYAYIPLVLYLIEKAIRKKDNLLFVLSGALLGIQIFTGHPNTPVMTLVISFLYLSVRLWRNKKDLVKNALLVFLTFLLVSLPYLIQLAILTPLSTRSGGVNFVDATNSSISPFEFITFFFPNFFFENVKPNWSFATTWHSNGYWGQIETTGYIGIVTLLLAPLAFFKRKRKLALIFAFFLIVSLMVALGKNTPFYELIVFKIPILNGLRAPAKFLLLADFSLAVIAAIGFNNLTKTSSSNKKALLLILTVTSLSVYLLIFLLIHFISLAPTSVGEFLYANYPQFSYQTPSSLANAFKTSLTFQTQTGQLLLGVATFLLMILVLRPKSLFIKLLIPTILVFDLFYFSKNVNLWTNTDNLLHKNNPEILKLKNELDYTSGRIYTYSSFWSDLLPNQLLPHHLPEANGFVSLTLSRQNVWQKNAESDWNKGNDNLFRMASIKYVYERKAETTELRPIKKPLPRTYFVDSWRVVGDKEKTLEIITSDSFDFDSEAVLELEKGESILPKKGGGKKILPARIDVYLPELVQISFDAPDDGLLVLTDTNFPGWRVFVNGKEEKIRQVNYLFRGVLISAGKNHLEFKFLPPHLLPTAIVSSTTLLSLAALFIIRMLKKTSR